jgi:polyisoprenoid-binding protein YceI
MQKKIFNPMMTLAVAFAIALILPIYCAQAQAPSPATKPAPLTGTWTIDPVHTSVTFSIGHLGLSQVQGRFDTASGTIVANKEHPSQSSVQFTIQTASVNTDNSFRDGDLKSKNYFDVADYPTITFQSTKVVATSTGYIAYGDLTMHGVTRTVKLPFQIEGPILDPFGSSRIGVVTQAVVSRLDYGVGGNGTIMDGAFAIGKDADVSISLEATPAVPVSAPKM